MQPETAGHEHVTTAEERLTNLVLSTPRSNKTAAAGTDSSSIVSSNPRVAGPSRFNFHTPGGGSAGMTPNSTSTPLSSARASRSADVVGDGSFEELMKERARVRKEKDEHSIAELRVQLAGMDRSLTAEIKRRVELSRDLENTCTTQISDMERRLNAIIDDRAELVESRLVAVEERVEELNHRLREESKTIPRDIEERGKELGEMLRKLQEEIAAERRDRLNREGRISKQVKDHRKYISELMAKEKLDREEAVEDIKKEIASIGIERAREGETFEQMVQRELRELRDAMGQEVQERRIEDDEIVSALNRYTDHLQQSLASAVQ